MCVLLPMADEEGMMAEFLTKRVNDMRDLGRGRSLEIHFRPGQPGEITVTSDGFVKQKIPPLHPLVGRDGDDDNEPPPVEGLTRRIDLLRPGAAAPVATVTAGQNQGQVPLRYVATAADLIHAGDWVCRVTNLSNSAGTFRTSVSYVSNVEIRSATFDLGLLNQLLFQAVGAAGIKIHLESSSSEDQKLSFVSWSQAITDVVGKDRESFAIAHAHGRRLRDLSSYSDFRGLRVGVRAKGGASDVVIQVLVGFETEGTELQSMSDFTPSVDIQSLDFLLEISLDGNPRVEVTTVATILGGKVDVSDEVRDGFHEAILDSLRKHDVPDKARVGIPKFLTRLMRLGLGARIHRAHVDGQRLVVFYYRDPVLISVPPTPVNTARGTARHAGVIKRTGAN